MADSYASLLELTCSCASAVHVHRAVVWQRLPLASSGSMWAGGCAPRAHIHCLDLATVKLSVKHGCRSTEEGPHGGGKASMHAAWPHPQTLGIAVLR